MVRLMSYIIGLVLTKLVGYGVMNKMGWGENLPKNAIFERIDWCINKDYYMEFLQKKLQARSVLLF